GAGVDVESAEPEPRSLSLGGHVGFDSLPDQLVSKSVTQGFSFNILCVGETGIGKSTLMNTLFNTTFETEEASHHEASVRLRPQTYDLQESNVQLKLTIVDAVGFGDQINKDESYRPIVDYIDAQFESYLQEELKIRRSLFDYHDTRIHVCLYFITPTGHSLKSLDLVTMKKLDSKVNIIPIIAKADTISKSELHKFKIKIMGELVSNGVQIYQFPTDDEAVAEINAVMNAHLPFAVVGSTEEVKVGNKLVRARQYPWGVVQVENENHCDFVKLREMLIRVNMEDLREQTHSRHYELYRRCKLEEMGFQDSDGDSQPFSLQETYEAKRKEFLSELQRKEEEMRQLFVNKVKETELELKEKEREVSGGRGGRGGRWRRGAQADARPSRSLAAAREVRAPEARPPGGEAQGGGEAPGAGGGDQRLHPQEGGGGGAAVAGPARDLAAAAKEGQGQEEVGGGGCARVFPVLALHSPLGGLAHLALSLARWRSDCSAPRGGPVPAFCPPRPSPLPSGVPGSHSGLGSPVAPAAVWGGPVPQGLGAGPSGQERDTAWEYQHFQPDSRSSCVLLGRPWHVPLESLRSWGWAPCRRAAGT
uniref:Septin 8 n=1 Tax=Propithecus coquereli TaxID=379532 RepID=A0A2K6FVW9_PROCO